MSAENADYIAFHLGSYTRASQAAVGVGSLAMRYALSVFEGIRAYRLHTGELRPFMLRAHLARLRSSLRLMCLPDPGVDEIPDIIKALTEKNEITEDCYIRPSVHAINSGDLNTDPVAGLTVTVTPMGRKKWLSQDIGVKATISSIRKISHEAFPGSAKCIGAYAAPFVAAAMAKSTGFDVPLLLNHMGYVTEAPTSAFAIVRGGKLVVPPLSDNVLPSVTAFVLLQLAKSFDVEVVERHLRPEDIALADEAILCGTGVEIAPIASVDGRPIRDFEKRPITRRLVEAYFNAARGRGTINEEDYVA